MAIPRGKSKVTMPEEDKKSQHNLARSKSSRMGTRSMSRLKMRQASFGYASTMGFSRGAMETRQQGGAEFRRPVLMFLNTFQLDSLKPFNRNTVTDIVNEVLDDYYDDHKYNTLESPLLVLRISGEIMRSIKGLFFNRYRIITVVTMGQRRAQSYNNAIYFVWDHERDDYVNVQREQQTNFIQVTVFGVYLD